MPDIRSLFTALRLPSVFRSSSPVAPDPGESTSPSPKAALATPDGLARRVTAGAGDLAPRASLPVAKPPNPKHIPYYSEKPTRLNDVSLNCEVPYPGAAEGSNEVVECRHLALAWAMQVDAAGKPDYAAFSSEDAIKKTVHPETGALFFRLTTGAPEVHLVPLEGWGQFVAQQLKSLEATGSPAAKQLLVNSDNHAMALELKVKQEPDGPRYVANFYDPNLTAAHKRVASNSIARFETLEMIDLLNRQSLLQGYFGNESVAMVIALPPGGPASLPPPPGNDPERRLAGPVPPLDESVMYPLLSFGFAGTLRDIKDQVAALASRDPGKAERLLAAQAGDGTPGLSMALADGHKHTVSAFIDLVAASGLPKSAQMRLLAAPWPGGTMDLDQALGNGRPETVQAYLDGLDRHPLLDDRDKAELLATRGAEGRTALVHALVAGAPDTVAAMVGWIARLDIGPDARCDLLLAIDNDKSPGLAEPMQANAADRVTAYAKAVLDSAMHEQEKVHVLTAGVATGELLAAAQEQGALQAIAAYRAAIRNSKLSLSAKAVLLGEPFSTRPAGSIKLPERHDMPRTVDQHEIQQRQAQQRDLQTPAADAPARA
ncbi:ShET2/EspL2 family type III secretion system effector toxin [Rhizobacter sp. Root1221]|uniref:ShET2/EspL2 family type III secretion system effector toxin n=1 Tax=Rhizobacter sp. Root1221 TaxID=1736433 RepID=UPI0009E8A69E|nr:ShET2/EspL2 family type III secretion system effector toxin [Rhizobacter sp. Root1221]